MWKHDQNMFVLTRPCRKIAYEKLRNCVHFNDHGGPISDQEMTDWLLRGKNDKDPVIKFARSANKCVSYLRLKRKFKKQQ